MSRRKQPVPRRMPPKYKSSGHPIGRGNQGVSSVEFALIAVPLLVLIFGTIQNLILPTAQVTLDSALQNLAYDAVNATPESLPKILNKQNLCNRKALFLVNCDEGSDLCFAVTSLDNQGSLKSPDFSCDALDLPLSFAGCCYQLTVEYDIPTLFDLTSIFIGSSTQAAVSRKLRSVAFVYRS